MAVRAVSFEPDYEVAPQAIIWRPLQYFTVTIKDGQDDLDHFKGASFAIGNDIRFDLRVYRGHPNPHFTVTLYLPEDITDEKRITEILNIVIDKMFIPLHAIAWRRGQPFEYGKLDRPKADRLFEDEARVLVLKIASLQTNRTVTMKVLRDEVPKFVELSPRDRTQSKTRAREQMWHQIIRNVTSSHQRGKRGLFGMGLAEKKGDSIKVTKKGMTYLNSIGFISSSTSDFEE